MLQLIDLSFHSAKDVVKAVGAGRGVFQADIQPGLLNEVWLELENSIWRRAILSPFNQKTHKALGDERVRVSLKRNLALLFAP